MDSSQNQKINIVRDLKLLQNGHQSTDDIFIYMMTSSNGNIFRVTGHLCGEFTGPGEFPTQRPVTRSFDVYFDLRPNKWLSKQSWSWWFETLSCSLWRHCNEKVSRLRPCKMRVLKYYVENNALLETEVNENKELSYCEALRCETKKKLFSLMSNFQRHFL